MVKGTEAVEQALVKTYAELYPRELARELESRPPTEIGRVLERQAPATAAAVIAGLLPEVAAMTLDSLGDEAFRNLIPALEPARAAALLAHLDGERRASRLSLLPDEIATELEALMTYPVGSAGAIMDPRIVALRPDQLVKHARAMIRRRRERRIYSVFVVDDDGRLLGIVPVQEIAIGEANQRLADLISGPPVSVRATAADTEAVELFQQHRMTSLPVTDFEGRLVGIIRHAALLTAFEEDAAADIQRMVGVSKDERALSTIRFSVRKRLPWLQINLGTAFLAAFVVGLFESTIAQYTALAVLLPVAAGQSGNTGAQALAVTMRGLALREIRVRHWLRLALKELAVGATNGMAVAIVTAVVVFLWSQSAGLSLVIGLAMVISMAIAGVAGASVPIVLTLLRQDPAQASSIILTTVTDIAGFLSFLGLATLAAGLL